MVKLVPVDLASLDTHREGRRGRVSYPIIKSFLESNIKCAMVDLTGLDKNPTYLRSVLHMYTQSHKLPIKIFTSGGNIHMLRLDLDAEGNKIEDWTFEPPEGRASEGSAAKFRDLPAAPITREEVSKRFSEEIGKSTS